MSVKEKLKNLGISTFEYVNEKIQELKEQFLEMAPLKSDFDIEKFTVKKEGNFIAHNFHFLMRQYSLTLYESKKMLIEREEINRKILECDELLSKNTKKIFIYDNGKKEVYVDLYKNHLINQMELLEINIANKSMRLIGFEACRLKLIELNGHKAPTNEQYQKEEPAYWKWFLSKKVLFQRQQRTTGVSEGVFENIHYLEEPALINKNFQVKMMENGKFKINEMVQEVELRKQESKKLE